MKTSLTKPVARVAALLFLAAVPCAIAGSISTSTINGLTVVTWNGKEVYRGTPDGPVQAKSASVQGKEFAAVLAGDKVIWESEAGAADAIKAGMPDPLKLLQPGNGNPGNRIKATTVDGTTTIEFDGKEVWKGKTDGKVTCQSMTIDGKTYAAAFDGLKVLWENVPGAARKIARAAKLQRKEEQPQALPDALPGNAPGRPSQPAGELF